jgi:Flp pilus assembly protein TadD
MKRRFSSRMLRLLTPALVLVLLSLRFAAASHHHPPPAPAGSSDKLAQLQQDIEFHLQNRDRAQAELRSLEQRSDTEEQQAKLRSRIALTAPTLDDHLLRYRIHSKQGDDQAALAAVDALRQLLPEDRGVMRMQAALLIRLGRSAEADALLQKANR